MDPNIEAQALAALTADIEGTPSEQAPSAEPQPVQPDYGRPNQNEVTYEDSFTNVDPATLPPELQQMYRSMQADYTRKTQEIAPYRKLGVGADELSNLVTWFNSVQTDANAQLELYNALADHLRTSGMLNDADPAPANDDPLGFNLDADDTPANTNDPIHQKVDELSRWVSEQREQAAINAAHIELMNIEQQIRDANPTYQDDDMAEIYKLSLAYGGDLVQAESDYRAMRERLLGSYLDSKGRVVTAHAQPAANQGHARIPESIKDTKEAEAAAIEAIKRGDYDLWN